MKSPLQELDLCLILLKAYRARYRAIRGVDCSTQAGLHCAPSTLNSPLQHLLSSYPLAQSFAPVTSVALLDLERPKSSTISHKQQLATPPVATGILSSQDFLSAHQSLLCRYLRYRLLSLSDLL